MIMDCKIGRAAVGSNGGRGSRAFRKLSARLRGELPPVCWLCCKPIDLALHHLDPWSWTLDHVTPLAVWPEGLLVESNLRPAHRRCNMLKGAGGWTPSQDKPRSSRKWT